MCFNDLEKHSTKEPADLLEQEQDDGHIPFTNP